MLWKHYVYRRGNDVHDMWDDLFASRTVKLLYITGQGFDLRAQIILKQFVYVFERADAALAKAEMLLIGLPGYRLSDELQQQTSTNNEALRELFGSLANARISELT